MFKNLILNKKFQIVILITILVLLIIFVVIFKKNTDAPANSDTLNICNRKLADIRIVGTWQYQGEEMPNWRFEFSEEKTFQYFTGEDNFTSSGKWEFNEQDNTITIFILDQFDYWNKEFFNNPELLSISSPGISAINTDNYSITFLINEFQDDAYQGYECGIFYKSIVLFELELIKFE